MWGSPIFLHLFAFFFFCNPSKLAIRKRKSIGDSVKEGGRGCRHLDYFNGESHCGWLEGDKKDKEGFHRLSRPNFNE